MKAARNDSCPCGSGKKFKQCHGKGRIGSSSGTRIVAPLFGVLLVAGALWAFLGRNAPQGKVWSEEHGHWHDAPGNNTGAQPGSASPPPGQAPEGKVWSSEHGHWHDAAPTDKSSPRDTSVQPPTTQPTRQDTGVQALNAPAGSVPQPPGPAPPGKVWSPEHGHWHEITLTPQPPGPVPEGKVWSQEHGHWHDAPAAQTKSSGTPTSPASDSIRAAEKTSRDSIQVTRSSLSDTTKSSQPQPIVPDSAVRKPH